MSVVAIGNSNATRPLQLLWATPGLYVRRLELVPRENRPTALHDVTAPARVFNMLNICMC